MKLTITPAERHYEVVSFVPRGIDLKKYVVKQAGADIGRGADLVVQFAVNAFGATHEAQIRAVVESAWAASFYTTQTIGDDIAITTAVGRKCNTITISRRVPIFAKSEVEVADIAEARAVLSAPEFAGDHGKPNLVQAQASEAPLVARVQHRLYSAKLTA